MIDIYLKYQIWKEVIYFIILAIVGIVMYINRP